MIPNKLKQILFPLLSGSGVGAALTYFAMAPQNIQYPSPEFSVAIDSVQGVRIKPGNLEGFAENVVILSTINGVLKEDTIAATGHSFYAFPWNDQVNTFQLNYLNSEGAVITTHTTRMSDGIIVDDLIIINRTDDNIVN